MASEAGAFGTLGEFAQRVRWRAFRDPIVEAQYRAWHREEIIPVARVVGVVSAVLWGVVPIWYRLVPGGTPREITVGAWAVAVPTFLIVLLSSYTSARRWATAGITIANIVIGLDFIWVFGNIYGSVSGTVACGVFASIFYPLIIRLPTGAAAIVSAVLTAVPIALQIEGLRQGRISFSDGWPYIALLTTNLPIVILAAAQIEAGMRRQFAARQTIDHQHRQLEASQRLLRRYAPAAVAERIESGDDESVGVPQRLRVTALSSDIAGFTVLADRLDPESLSEVVNEYVGAMSGVVEGLGGVVTEFAGDGLMAVFGAPTQLDPTDQVRQALAAADAMHRRLEELNHTWGHLGIAEPLKVRIGINTGVMSVGTFGSDGRATYTAIGLQMNIAARIQSTCTPGSTLLSSASWHLVKDEVPCESLGEVMVKGVHFPIAVYARRA